jgi:hypothetical protein
MCQKQIPTAANSIKTGDPTIKPLSSNSAVMKILAVLIDHKFMTDLWEDIDLGQVDLVIRYTARRADAER